MEDVLSFDFESFLREENDKTLKREELNHSKISEESDRGAIIVAAALLDDALRAKICKRLFDCSMKKDPLFDDGNAPLGTFSAKIELAFRLGEIDEECKKTLNTFKKLRNSFAHDASVTTLLSEPIRSKLISSIEHSPNLVNQLKEKSSNLGYNVHDCLHTAKPRTLLNVAFSVLIDSLRV